MSSRAQAEQHIEVHKFYGGAVVGVAFLALVLQGFLNKFGSWAGLLELPLLVTIYFSLSRRNPATGLLLGMGIGILQDAVSQMPIGFYGIAENIRRLRSVVVRRPNRHRASHQPLRPGVRLLPFPPSTADADGSRPAGPPQPLFQLEDTDRLSRKRRRSRNPIPDAGSPPKTVVGAGVFTLMPAEGHSRPASGQVSLVVRESAFQTLPPFGEPPPVNHLRRRIHRAIARPGNRIRRRCARSSSLVSY